MSSAQQWAWLEGRTPTCSRASAATSTQGRFVPVGGMWVESDTNMVGGEAMARQFVLGKRWFAEHLGVEPARGLAARLVRLHRRAAADRHAGRDAVVPDPEDLVEHHQPLPPPHVLVGGHRRHPGASPTSRRSTPTTPSSPAPSSPTRRPTSATRASRPGRWCRSGTATGAAGRPARCSAAGAPYRRPGRARPGSSRDAARRSSTAAEEEYADRAPVWTGELLPRDPPRHLHLPGRDEAGQPPLRAPAPRGRAVVGDGRGTRAARLPGRRAAAAWETVLLHQFHDILPGSSIAWVHREARATYARVDGRPGGDRRTRARRAGRGGDDEVAFNAAPVARLGGAGLGAGSVGRRPAGVDRRRDRRRRGGARERRTSGRASTSRRRDPVDRST